MSSSNTRVHTHSKVRSALPLRAATLSLVLASLLASPKAAHAEASASDRATARALAGEGYKALKVKDFATAEDRFRRADELVHAPTLVLDHARALIGLGRYGEAYAAFDAVTREVLPPNAPAVWTRAIKDAQVELEAIKPKVAWLTLHLKGASDPEIEIDGRPLPLQSLGDRLPETPGELRIVVSAQGFITQTVTKRLSAGEEGELEIALEPVPKPAPVFVVAPPAPVSNSGSGLDDRGNRHRTLAYVSFGVAGLGVAVGTATGILWLKARSDVKSACGGLACQAQNGTEQARFKDDKRRYDTFGTLSGVGFAVGVAGAATGLILLLSGPEAPTEAKQAGIHPYVGPGAVGVYGAFQ
ncbi:MAG: hypothetical protein ABIQ16_11725 [Polyangiaceae bacterium]